MDDLVVVVAPGPWSVAGCPCCRIALLTSSSRLSVHVRPDRTGLGQEHAVVCYGGSWYHRYLDAVPCTSGYWSQDHHGERGNPEARAKQEWRRAQARPL